MAQGTFLGMDILFQICDRNDDKCFGCSADENARAAKTDRGYMIWGQNGEDVKEEGEGTISEAGSVIWLCANHTKQLLEQMLVHVVMVSRGKEQGAIKLPLKKEHVAGLDA